MPEHCGTDSSFVAGTCRFPTRISRRKHEETDPNRSGTIYRALGHKSFRRSICVAASASEFSGGYVPPSYLVGDDALRLVNTRKGVGKVAGARSKLTADLSKCFTKGARNVSRGKSSGVAMCINGAKKGAVPKYLAYVANTSAKTALPACHNFPADAVTIWALVKSFNPQIYWQSPSGAFLDSATF